MADDLDSFFAKKDKKGKNKKKAIVLTIEDNFDEEEEPVSQKKANVDLNKLKGFIEDENEWGDFEDEDKRDYSGLKIQQLNISEQEEEQRAKEDMARFTDTVMDEVMNHVWAADKALNGDQAKEGEEANNEEKDDDSSKENAEGKTMPGSLVPMSLREFSAKSAPSVKINDVEEFPDLSDSIKMEVPKESKPFKMVGSGAGSSSSWGKPPEKDDSMAEVHNRYSFLKGSQPK